MAKKYITEINIIYQINKLDKENDENIKIF